MKTKPKKIRSVAFFKCSYSVVHYAQYTKQIEKGSYEESEVGAGSQIIETDKTKGLKKIACQAGMGLRSKGLNTNDSARPLFLPCGNGWSPPPPNNLCPQMLQRLN